MKSATLFCTLLALGIAALNRPAVAQTPPSAGHTPPPVRYHFDLSETSLSSHNGTLNGGGWGTQLRAGVSWNHIDNTVVWRNNAVSLQFPTMNQGWDESYWDDDLDYCWDDDFPDGQVARINLGFSYQHLDFNDTGFRYTGSGFGFNTGFSLQSSPQVSEYGRINYFPTVNTDFKLPGATGTYQFDKQQYDFGIRYRPSLNSKFFIEGGFSEEVMHGKNSQAGGIYNYGPYLGLGSRF